MNQPTNRNRVFLLLIPYILLNLFASGRWTVPVAAWIAPIFALYILRTRTGRRGVLAGFGLVYLATYASQVVSWYGATIAGEQIIGHAIFMVITVLIAMVPLIIDRVLAGRLHPSFASTLVYPLALTMLEYFFTAGNPLGSFGVSAYSQAGAESIMQVSAVFGLWGINFLLGWFAAIVVWALLGGMTPAARRRGLVGSGVFFALVILAGSARLWLTPISETTVDVAAFNAVELHVGEMMALLESDPAAFRAQTQANHQLYLERTRQAAAAGAQIVLWSEAAGLGTAEDVDALVAAGQELAAATGIYLAMPVLKVYPDSDRPGENKLYLADPSGAIVLEHIKFGGNQIEGTLPGSGELQVVDTPYGRLSVAICWDADFPAAIAAAGRQNVDILLSPSLEWAGIDPMHAEMVSFRAVENGVNVVRIADQGRSVIVDPLGRVTTSADQSLTAAVPTAGVNSLYPALGDIIANLAGLGLLILTGLAIVTGRRRAGVAATSVDAGTDPSPTLP